MLIWDRCTCLWKWNSSRVVVTKLNKPKETKRSTKRRQKRLRKRKDEEQEVPIPLFTHVKNTLHSILSNVEVYSNNQQTYNSNVIYVHKSYTSNNFKVSVCEYKGVLTCEDYDKEEFPDEIMVSHLSELFFTRRMKRHSRPDGFILYGKLAADCSCTSDLLYQKRKIQLRLIRARTNFDMISDHPNVSFLIVDCSLYNGCFALKDDNHNKRMDMLAYAPVEFNYLETLAGIFIVATRQSRFVQEHIFNKSPVRRIAISISRNSAFTGSYTKNPIWYQHFDLRQLGVFRRG